MIVFSASEMIKDEVERATVTEPPARQAFRARLAQVTADARAALPQCNGRVDEAARLVLHGEVQLRGGGVADVGSRSDVARLHTVTSAGCPCQDAQYQAPDGWCSHRLARAMAIRMQRAAQEDAMAQEEPPPMETPPSAPHLQTAPQAQAVPRALETASPQAAPHWSAQLPAYTDTLQWVDATGLSHSLCLRADTLEDLLQQVANVQQWRQRQQAQPATHPAHTPREGFCATHHTPMRKYPGKDGKPDWYSHRTQDGQRCRGR